LMDLID